MSGPRKVYLGDGAYASFDGYGLTFTTEDGIRVTNSIYLEPDVWAHLARFMEALKSTKTEPEKP